MRSLVSVLALCLLAGCATVQQPGVKQEPAAAAAPAEAAPAGNDSAKDDVLSGLDKEYDGKDGVDQEEHISDPLKPWNVVWFHFNDKVYLWVLRPVSIGYGKAVPKPARTGINNFFENLRTPVKAISCLLQGRWEDTGRVMERFAVNTTAGGLGFYDFAAKKLDVADRNEDADQTFGRWGIPPGCYIIWPFVGASSLRGTVGMACDGAVSPATWVPYSYIVSPTSRTLNVVNATSLDPDFYKDLKSGAADPYAAIRHAYFSNRRKLVKE